MPLLPLPTIPTNSINREFIIDDVKVEITSVDIASHGGFVIVGCSNGVILFFDLTENHFQRNGTFLAHIRAKGMHTTFRLNVKIAEDSRMCFAGVLKGSSEMVAIDLSLYQLNWNKFIREKGGKNRNPSPAPFFDPTSVNNFKYFSYSDAKLRGFGAATCVPLSTSATVTNDIGEEVPAARKYFLACGMGIKNVHVWQVIINDHLTLEEIEGNKKRDEWTCIYDVASNGMTITHLGFRHEGKELLTKSHGMNIRVWDLTKYHEEPQMKPSYEDIQNTFDVKCLLENSTFTYGGVYEFAVVNVDKNIPKEANRNVLELPASLNNYNGSNMDDGNSRRRSRAMREVQDVISTQDGIHVLILCSDGGVLYYKQPEDHEMIEDEGKIEELSNLQRDLESDQVWYLRRIGKQGMVLLLRAYYKLDKLPKAEPVPAGTIPPMTNSVTPGKTGVNVISITTLTDFSYNINTSLLKDSQWHRTGNYYQEDLPPALVCATPSILAPFNSNPSTSDGGTLSTPRPFMTTLLDGDTPNFMSSIDSHKIGGIALDTPIPLSREPSFVGSESSSAGEKGNNKTTATSGAKKETQRSGLPPTSKKRKATQDSNLETPAANIAGASTSGVKRTPKIKSQSQSTEFDEHQHHLSTPVALEKSESFKGKRSVETKLFASTEKSSLEEGGNDSSHAMHGEEGEEDDPMMRLLSMKSPTKPTRSSARVTKIPPNRMESEEGNDQDDEDEEEEYDPIIRIAPPPKVRRVIPTSDEIQPICMDEAALALSQKKLFTENLLEKWERDFQLTSSLFHKNFLAATSLNPAEEEISASSLSLKNCLVIPSSLRAFLLPSQDLEEHPEQPEESIILDELSEEILSYERQLQEMNSRFSLEHRQFQEFFKEHLKSFLSQHTPPPPSSSSSSSPSSSSLLFWKQCRSFLQSMKSIHLQELLQRQECELKSFYASLMISMKHPVLLQFLSFYQKKPLDPFLMTNTDKNKKTRSPDSVKGLVSPDSSSSSSSLLSVSFQFPFLFEQTEQFLREQLSL